MAETPYDITNYDGSKDSRDHMIHVTVDKVLDDRQRFGRKSVGDFFVVVIFEKNKRLSYWGIIDFETIPEEDIYLEVARRFDGAGKVLHDRAIGFGLVDMISVLQRTVDPPELPSDDPLCS